MTTSSFRIIAATHTPFGDDGALKLDRIGLQAEWLVRCEVNGVFVGGTTGEVSSLTMDERMALAECWCDVAKKSDLEVIVHVGHNNQIDARRLAAHAESVGADAVAALPPNYFKPQTVTELVEFLAPIAREASDLPFYYYSIPAMTDVRLSMTEFLEQGPLQIPNLAGLKYSDDDLVQLQQCSRIADGGFEMLFGRDEAMLAAVALGVDGAVGSTYNFIGPLYRRLLRAFSEGDLETARTLQFRSATAVLTLASFGYMAASKHVMRCLGIDCGPVRPPLPNLDDERRAQLQQALEEIRFFEDTLPPVATSARPTPLVER
jgi:N-acetylneuraminate lyase